MQPCDGGAGAAAFCRRARTGVPSPVFTPVDSPGQNLPSRNLPSMCFRKRSSCGRCWLFWTLAVCFAAFCVWQAFVESSPPQPDRDRRCRRRGDGPVAAGGRGPWCLTVYSIAGEVTLDIDCTGTVDLRFRDEAGNAVLEVEALPRTGSQPGGPGARPALYRGNAGGTIHLSRIPVRPG